MSVSAPELLEIPRARRGVVWSLGLGAFGLAFATTMTAAYLPPHLARFTESSTLIALVLGAEGLFALALPLVIGPWSDTFPTPLGRRRPFMLAALGPMAFCLLLVGFMPSFWTTAVVVLAFFFAYYVYEPPYRGLYPDLLPDTLYARGQGVQHLLRGLAIAGALVGGGYLFEMWRPAPFAVAALVTAVACGATIVLVKEGPGHGHVFRGVRRYLAASWAVFRSDRDVRRFLVANAAWEATFAGARTFVVLYVTVGLGQPITVSSLVLATVAGGYIVAAVGSGLLGERFGLARVIAGASVLYGGGLLAGGLADTWNDWYYALIFPVAVAGGTVMTLSWGLLFKLMPREQRGAVAGLATGTKGVGLLLGPLVVGGAIDLLAPYLEQTEGYQVVWPLCGVPVLAVLPLVASLARVEKRRGRASR